MRRKLSAVFIAIILGTSAAANAQGKFDGQWNWGPTTHFNDAICSMFTWSPFTIDQNRFSGSLGFPWGNIWLSGSVDQSGKATFYGTQSYALIRLQGEFAEDTARGTAKVSADGALCDFDWSARRTR